MEPRDERDYRPDLRSYRITSVDLLRGLAMVVMLLDHTRLYVDAASLHIDPTDLSRTSASLFLTRLITHPVAPIFVFLAGTAVYLQTARGKTKTHVSRLLLTRGLWLVVLEFTVVRLGINFNLDYAAYLGSMQVIWAIGISMIVLAALIHLPLPAVAVISVAIIAGHNLLDAIHVPSWKGPKHPAPGLSDVLWLVLHQPGAFLVCPYPCPRVYVLYPLIPWVAVMSAGFSFGAVYRLTPALRRRVLFLGGFGLILCFFVLRALNVYGDPHPWSPQKSMLFTVLSFLDVTKYPVSLLFLLMTLGPAMVMLALLEGMRPGRGAHPFLVFGRVPLFFYLINFYVAHGLAVLTGLAAGQPVAFQFAPHRHTPQAAGFDLWVVYLLWLAGVCLLYPLCLWFSRVKRRRKDWWLSYL